MLFQTYIHEFRGLGLQLGQLQTATMAEKQDQIQEQIWGNLRTLYCVLTWPKVVSASPPLTPH